MSYYCKNRLRNIVPATAGSAGPVPAPLKRVVNKKILLGFMSKVNCMHMLVRLS